MRALLVVLTLLQLASSATAVAAPYTGHGVATQGSVDGASDHRPLPLIAVCPAAGTLHRVQLTLEEGAPTDVLTLSGDGATGEQVSAVAGVGDTVTIYAYSPSCVSQDYFTVEGTAVRTVAIYHIDVSVGCYMSDVEFCEEHVWD